LRHPHIHTTSSFSIALLLAVVGLPAVAAQAAADYTVVPGSAGNSVRLAVECRTDWQVAANIVSRPAWVTRANVTSTPVASGVDVDVAFDVDPAAPLEATGVLVVSLEARNALGQSVATALRRVTLRPASSAPEVQHSFLIDECCVPVAGVETDQDRSLKTSVLLDVAPNPSRGLTSIRFGLVTAGSVSLRILDVAGRVVRQIRTPELTAGYHQISWEGKDEDGRAVAAGLYFFELKAGAWQGTGKTLLLR
jgi:flagellar hook capping protein FlgD